MQGSSVIGPVPGGLLLALGTSVPSLVALALAARSGSALALLSGLTRWRLPARWYAAAFLIPAALMLTVVGLDAALGGTPPVFPSPARWPLVAVNFLAVLLIGGPLGEELGWRGYALPRLDRRLNSTAAAVLLGLIWAAWHLPLFLLPGTPQAQLPLAWFVVQTVAFSVVLAWVYRRTGGSLLLVVLLHGAVNTLAGLLRVLPTAENTLRPYTLLTVTAALLVNWRGTVRQASPNAQNPHQCPGGRMTARPQPDTPASPPGSVELSPHSRNRHLIKPAIHHRATTPGGSP